MAVRCVGAEYMRTSPTQILTGNSPVSISFWVRINPGSGTAAADSLVFGSGADNFFSAAIIGGTTAALRLQWPVAGGSFEYGIASNAPVHVAMTYSAGLQQYFINGALAATGTVARSLADLSGGRRRRRASRWARRSPAST